MAGFYTDVPGNRFAYHLDGTAIYIIDSTNTLTNITSGAASFNDEDGDYPQYSGQSFLFIFPELRNLSGYYFNDMWGVGPQSLQFSSDTTTGLDGTWTTIVNPWARDMTGGTLPSYRTKINPVSAGSVKGLKFNFGSSGIRPANIHLYGDIPSSSNPDRLIFWEPVNNNATGGSWFDWGDLVQGTSQTKTFRIKNNSGTKTANSILLTAGTETFAMSVDFSSDDITYTPSLSLGDLAPGAVTGVLYVRRTVPASEPLRMQAAYFKAAASSWT